jgi:hypothetical protein
MSDAGDRSTKAVAEVVGQTKGLIESISVGVRQLLVLDEKLVALGKEDERSRALLGQLQQTVERLVGTVGEMDKRLAERFAELDKRLIESDRRVALQIELAVRNELDKRLKGS